jgi:ABC-type phosphate transport system substrate-binding protein
VRGRLVIVVLALAVAVAGCSSSSAPPQASTPPAGHTSAGSSSVPEPAQPYLDAVNALCDKLLPKIVKVTRGGSIDVPVRKYLASWPAHKRLLAQFDTDLAAVSVPPAARTKAAAFAAYIRFADRLDAARLKAAHRGQAAYAKEVQAESGAADDPTITALTAAGFNESCTAR